MKVICGLSSVEFRVEHIPLGLQSRETYHPIFDATIDQISRCIATNWPEKLTPTESYLCYLALLKSTGKLNFYLPAIRSTKTDAVIAQNMEYLLRVVSAISAIQTPGLELPSFVLTPETRTLENSHYWLESWQKSIEDFYSGNKAAQLHDRIVTKEMVMERLIKDPSKTPSNYANILADWAELAGEFPQFTVTISGEETTCSAYWKQIIRRCSRAESLFSIDDSDLQELIEHCEDNIDHGSIYSATLMRVLRDARDRKKSYLGLGDLDITSSTYRILSDSDTAERANILAMIDSAPSEKPIESNYPSKIAYLRALFKWQAAQEHAKQIGNGESK